MSYLNLISAAADPSPAPQLAKRGAEAAESEEQPFESVLSGAMDREREETAVKEPEPTAVTEELEEDAAELAPVEEAAPLSDDQVEGMLIPVPTAGLKPEGTLVETPVDSEPIQGLTALEKPRPEGTLEPVAEPRKGEGRPVLPEATVQLPRPGLAGRTLTGIEKPPVLPDGELGGEVMADRAAPAIPLVEGELPVMQAAAAAPVISSEKRTQGLPAQAETDTQARAIPMPEMTEGARAVMETEIDKARPAVVDAQSPKVPIPASAENSDVASSTVQNRDPVSEITGDRPVAVEAAEELQPREALRTAQAPAPAQELREGEAAIVRPQAAVEEPAGTRVSENSTTHRSTASQRPTPITELPRQTLRIIQEMKSNGQNNFRAEIRLDPPELGRIRIELNVEGERTWARMVVESAAAKEQIQSELPRIKELLETQGLEEARVEVQLRKEDAREQQAGREGGRETGENEMNGEEDQGAVRIRRSEHDGLIDLRA
jgi:hypothetical protein